MGSSISCLHLALKSLISSRPWLYDPSVVEMEWKDQFDTEGPKITSPNERLCFGILECDGVVNPHPPIVRALNLVKQTLSDCGHSVSHILWDTQLDRADYWSDYGLDSPRSH